MQPEKVWDYPRPPRLEPVAERVTAALGGQTILDTTAAWRVLETSHPPTYYIPPGEIRAELRPAAGRSLCEWKGQARYFDLVAGDTVAPRAAWAYDAPTAAFGEIAGFVSLYASALDGATVGGLPVLAQAGDFYGGWITPNLTGPFKGAPGTLGW